jgi:hypothetical protein
VAALRKKIADGAGPLLWLDDFAYAERLLAVRRADWLDAAALVAFRRKAAGLLRPDVAVLPIDVIIRVWLELRPGLREAMAAKKRTIAPLRTLLADEALRARLVELARALRASFPAEPLALSLPSPRKWIGDAWQEAFGVGAAIEVGREEVDSASVYIAEFLRGFGEVGVDCLLLEEAAGAEPESAVEVGWYQPVINVVGHYRWELGLRLPTAAAFSGELPTMSFAVAPRPLPGCIAGVTVAGAFWTGAAAPAMPPGGFRFAEIPAGCVPEQALERLAALRSVG